VSLLDVGELLSPNQEDRPAGVPIDTLILHYTGMRTARDAIDRLRDPVARVSSHYVVDEDGAIFRLVPEERRAFHAGVSYWRGHSDLNGRSVGIEIVNPGHEWGYCDFPALQMAAVCDLCLGILARHPIPARNVVAHSDVAPDRKEDPGEKFDWQGLAANGVGLWPEGDDADTVRDVRAALADIGYRVDLDLPVVLRAFQRHWRQEAITGEPDAGTLGRIGQVWRLASASQGVACVPESEGAGENRPLQPKSLRNQR
jgi:N-acetylmuramoyl-L-alanine amidase